MRVLMASWAWPTHYTPLVPVAWALRAAGHEVRVASQPALQKTITDSGAVAVPTGPDLDHDEVRRRSMQGLRLTQVPEAPPSGGSTASWSPEAVARLSRVFGVFVAYAEAMADDLLSFARHWRPDLIVYDPTTYAAPLVAATLGIPAVRHVHGVDVTYQAREVVPALLAPLAERLGAGPPDVMGVATIDPCPPSLQIASDLRRIPVRYVPYNGPAVLPDWARDDTRRRRLCVTWGTSTTRLEGSATFLPPRVVAAARDLDTEIVMALTEHDAAAMGELPAGVRVAESLPLHLFVASCSAVVHQGGNGTLLTAARYGVPQLILPQLRDQQFHAGRLADAGAGLSLPPGEADDAAIRDGLRAVLDDPRYTARASQIADEMLATPPPSCAVPELEALACPSLTR